MSLQTAAPRSIAAVLVTSLSGRTVFGLMPPVSAKAKLGQIETLWRSRIPGSALECEVFETTCPRWTSLTSIHPLQKTSPIRMSFHRSDDPGLFAELRQKGRRLLLVSKGRA